MSIPRDCTSLNWLSGCDDDANPVGDGVPLYPKGLALSGELNSKISLAQHAHAEGDNSLAIAFNAAAAQCPLPLGSDAFWLALDQWALTGAVPERHADIPVEHVVEKKDGEVHIRVAGDTHRNAFTVIEQSVEHAVRAVLARLKALEHEVANALH